MDEGIVQIVEGSERKEVRVIILVVVEDGLVRKVAWAMFRAKKCLNPYCSGQWSPTSKEMRDWSKFAWS